ASTHADVVNLFILLPPAWQMSEEAFWKRVLLSLRMNQDPSAAARGDNILQPFEQLARRKGGWPFLRQHWRRNGTNGRSHHRLAAAGVAHRAGTPRRHGAEAPAHGPDGDGRGPFGCTPQAKMC